MKRFSSICSIYRGLDKTVFFLLVAVPALFAMILGCSNGTSSTSPGSSPSNLSYPQATITAAVGQAVSASTPTVSGTVTSYTVTPALPAGLSLNGATGVISGTPTAAAAQTTYTITAGNSSGSTSTTIQIAVTSTVVPPSGLVYPLATIVASVGQTIPADTPTVTGTVTSYSASPALPAGLSLNTITGAISGTPTATASATYTVTAANSAGSTSAAIQITVNAAVPPPSSLVYPQMTITATIGQAISSDTPTLTGTVTSYSVSPALPAGLSLNTTTGVISGTPTATAASATYTVTGTNSAGSASATIQITVNAAVLFPSVTYLQTTITATVGQPITPDVPSTQGTTVTSFAVSPALPAGLSLDSSTGAISGTPTAITPQAAYTVTASNSAGSTTAVVSVTVNKAYTSLLNLGHTNGIMLMRANATRVLSQDNRGHWALWDYTSGAQITSGDQFLPVVNRTLVFNWTVDLAGPTVVIGITGGLQVFASSDGHLISNIIAPLIDAIDGNGSWWKLASDGSYICTGSKLGLSVWSPAGQLLFSRQGDYSHALVYASPAQIQAALGPAGQNVIETISTADGTSSVGPTFSGTFNSWFLDGQRFLTNTGTTVWTYSNSSVQQAIVSLPTVQNLIGQGNWISTYTTDVSPSPLAIYAVGANSPSATFNESVLTTVVPSGLTLGVLSYGAGSGSVIDLSGSTPVKTDFTISIAYLSAYAATSASQWLVGNNHGVVLDGATLSTTPRYLARGQAWSVAGGTGTVAIATADGEINYFNSATTTSEGTISFPSSKIELSSDGTVLAAAANSNDAQYEADRTLKFYSLPSGTLTSSIPYQFATGMPDLEDFSLSGSGTVLGQVTAVLAGTNPPLRQVAPVSSGPTIWSDSVASQPIQLSPDGTSIAVSNAAATSVAATNIFTNGQLVTAVPGWVVGWIDNNRILVNRYTAQGYAGAAIYDATGANLATPSLPELLRLQPVSSGQVYSPDLNSIFSLTTGSPTWTASVPSTGVGAVAGSYVVFASGSQVLVDSY